MEGIKKRHYADLVAQRRFQLHPFMVETAGGMGAAVGRLVDGRRGQSSPARMGRRRAGAGTVSRHRCTASDGAGLHARVRTDNALIES